MSDEHKHQWVFLAGARPGQTCIVCGLIEYDRPVLVGPTKEEQ